MAKKKKKSAKRKKAPRGAKRKGARRRRKHMGKRTMLLALKGRTIEGIKVT